MFVFFSLSCDIIDEKLTSTAGSVSAIISEFWEIISEFWRNMDFMTLLGIEYSIKSSNQIRGLQNFSR